MEKIIKKPGIGRALLFGIIGALCAPFSPLALIAGGLFGYLLLAGGAALFALSGAICIAGTYVLVGWAGLWVPAASILFAMLTGALLKANKSYFDTALLGAAVYTAAFYLMVSLDDILAGGVAFHSITALFEEVSRESLAAAQAMPGMLPQQVAQMQQALDALVAGLPLYMPAVLCVAGAFTGLFNLLICTWRCRKAGVALAPMRRFLFWRIPREFVIGVVIMAAGSFLASSLGVSNMDAVTAAVAALAMTPFVVQGGSVVMFVLQFQRSAGTMVMFTLFLVLMLPMSLMLLCVLGVIEQLFHLRRRIIFRGKGDQEE